MLLNALHYLVLLLKERVLALTSSVRKNLFGDCSQIVLLILKELKHWKTDFKICYSTFYSFFVCVLMKILYVTVLYIHKQFSCVVGSLCGQDSVVSIVTRYGPASPGIKSQWAARTYMPYRLAPRPAKPAIQWIPGVCQG